MFSQLLACSIIIIIIITIIMDEQRRLQKENDQVLIVRTIMTMTMINLATIRLKREKKYLENLRPREDREALLLVDETTVWWRRRARRC